MIKEELLDKLLEKTKTIDNINDYNNNMKIKYRKVTREDKIIVSIFSLLFLLNACYWIIFNKNTIVTIAMVLLLPFLCEILFAVVFNVYCYCINYKEENTLDFLLRIRNNITLKEYEELYKYIEERDLFRNSVLDFLNIGYKENKEKERLLEFEREKEEKKKEYEIEKQEAIFLKKKTLAKMYSELR